MRVTLPSGRELRLIFSRDPHPRTKKEARRHRATRLVIAEDHLDHTHILGRASVKAHPPDVFTREQGRVEALTKALLDANRQGTLTFEEAFQTAVAYDQRPRPAGRPRKRRPRCFDPQETDGLGADHLRLMEQAARRALGLTA